MRGVGELSGEVIVVGGGVIGLAIAVELAERDVSVTLISERRPGEASPAAAGMLAPSVERAFGPAHDFGIAARDRYPSYVDFLADRTGVRVPLNRLGILQVALSDKGIKGLKKTALPTSRWIGARELKDLPANTCHRCIAVGCSGCRSLWFRRCLAVQPIRCWLRRRASRTCRSISRASVRFGR